MIGGIVATDVAPAPPPAAEVSGHRILVVDDDVVSRGLACTLLEASGFTVVSAADGEEALARLQSDPPYELMVLDLSMPKLDGRVVL